MRGLGKDVGGAILVVALGAGVPASAQEPAPAFVRDGKVWFEVVDTTTGERTDVYEWRPVAVYPNRIDECRRVGRRTPSLGVRYDSFLKRADVPGTFTLDACAPPASGLVEALPLDAPGRRVVVEAPGPEDPFVTLALEELAALERPVVFFGGTYRRFDRAPEATVSSETLTFRRNGQLLGQEPGETTAADLNDLFDLTYEEESTGVELEVAPKVAMPGIGHLIVRFQGRLRRTEATLLYDVPQPAPGIRRTEWSGRGNELEAGLDLDVPLGEGGLFLEAGGRYGVLLETDVTRSPGLSAAGGRITEDRGGLKRTTGSTHVAFGREWGDRVAVWAGAEARWDTIRLEGTATAEFAQAAGLLEQTVAFTNELESHSVRVFGGLEVRAAGPVYVRASYVGYSAGSAFSVSLGAGRRR